jgi:hypothetical protein
MANKVTVVTTAEGLKAAMDAGAAHVHITQHLNLSSLVPASQACMYGCEWFRPAPTLKSLTV